jgi:alcohol dehydrogenase
MLVVRALKIGHMADAGRIQTTLQSNLGKITAENIKRAHALIERGRSIGKIVLAGF